MKSKEFGDMQEKMLDINMKIMKQQFKPMFVTFLPYIIIFYFIGNSFAYVPFAEGAMVDVSINGEGALDFPCFGINETVDNFHNELELEQTSCTAVVNGEQINIALKGSEPVEMDINNIKMMVTPPKKTFIHLPVKLPFVGDSIGWLGTFIIFSLATSLILQKVLKGKYLRKWE